MIFRDFDGFLWILPILNDFGGCLVRTARKAPARCAQSATSPQPVRNQSATTLVFGWRNPLAPRRARGLLDTRKPGPRTLFLEESAPYTYYYYSPVLWASLWSPGAVRGKPHLVTRFVPGGTYGIHVSHRVDGPLVHSKKKQNAKIRRILRFKRSAI